MMMVFKGQVECLYFPSAGRLKPVFSLILSNNSLVASFSAALTNMRSNYMCLGSTMWVEAPCSKRVLALGLPTWTQGVNLQCVYVCVLWWTATPGMDFNSRCHNV